MFCSNCGIYTSFHAVVLSMPFQLKNLYASGSEKRSAATTGFLGESVTPTKVRKAPSAASLVLVDSVAKPKMQRLPGSGPLNIVVYKVTDKASDCWSKFNNTDAKLWQVQCDHAARPSVLSCSCC